MGRRRNNAPPKSFQAQFYSVKELPLELRKHFRLMADPYSKVPEDQRVITSQFNDLGIVFYRDEMHSKGVIFQPPDGNLISIDVRSGWFGYKYSGVFNLRTLQIEPWDDPTAAIIKKWGDDRAWLHWGQPHNVVAMNEERIICS